MSERRVYVSENIRQEREWWRLLKYGVGPPLVGAAPTLVIFWLRIL